MFESTATWAEDKVFPPPTTSSYMPTGRRRLGSPLTSDSGTKMYGSAIWNHWLDAQYGADAIRAAWRVARRRTHFAPGAYDASRTGRSRSRRSSPSSPPPRPMASRTAGSTTARCSPRPSRPAARWRSTHDAALRARSHRALGHDLYIADLAGATPLRLGAATQAPGTTGSIALVGVDGTDVTRSSTTSTPATRRSGCPAIRRALQRISAVDRQRRHQPVRVDARPATGTGPATARQARSGDSARHHGATPWTLTAEDSRPPACPARPTAG